MVPGFSVRAKILIVSWPEHPLASIASKVNIVVEFKVPLVVLVLLELRTFVGLHEYVTKP